MSKTTKDNTFEVRVKETLILIDKHYKESNGESDIQNNPLNFFSQKSSGFATDGEFASDLAMVFNIIKSQGEGRLSEYKVEYSFNGYDEDQGDDSINIAIKRPKRGTNNSRI